jgi:predicted nucleic-acid-binding protein
MIALDTNVVVRLMVEDDPTQVKRARRMLELAEEQGEPALVGDIVLCELDWVLSAGYRVPRQRILAALTELAADPRFRFEDPQRVRVALDLYQGGSADLADYLLGLAAESAGAVTTYTFDRGLRGDPRFTLVPA